MRTHLPRRLHHGQNNPSLVAGHISGCGTMLIPLSKTKETNVLLLALGKCATRKAMRVGRFLDKSAFLLGHGARTTPSSSLD
jgi:hypothetical protein